MDENTATTRAALDGDGLLAHWLGHRRLTRRTIEAFPEEALFAYHAPGMRSFGAMIHEVDTLLPIALQGAAEGTWRWPREYASSAPADKAELLAAFDVATADLETTLPRISSERFLAVDRPLPAREEPVVATLLYFLDNEIHHRAQGFVYLRELGIEPPAFHRR